MRIKDLSEEEIVVGLRVKGLKTGKIGTIVFIDFEDDRCAWIQWDGDSMPNSGFYGNDCKCEIVESEEDNG